MATLTLSNKDVATLTLKFRHGKEPTIGDMANLTFTDVLFPDGSQIKDITFNQIADQVWSYASKHAATLTLPTKS
jgi:hypothetical protein